MKASLVVLALVAALAPTAVVAYDPAPDQALIRVLGERVDGDVNAGLVPSDRAALVRAELDVTQRLITNGDSQATAMLADIDRDLAALDDSLDVNESNRDLLYHSGDTITFAMRDGVDWRIDTIGDPDIFGIKKPGALNPPGVQGAYLAKAPGYTNVTLVDPASTRRVHFRIYIVDRAAGS